MLAQDRHHLVCTSAGFRRSYSARSSITPVLYMQPGASLIASRRCCRCVLQRQPAPTYYIHKLTRAPLLLETHQGEEDKNNGSISDCGCHRLAGQTSRQRECERFRANRPRRSRPCTAHGTQGWPMGAPRRGKRDIQWYVVVVIH